MKITWKEFQEQSKRTMPFQGHATNTQELYNVLGNYALGTLGEWLEYQHEMKDVDIMKDVSYEKVVKVEKEVGDVSHYLVGLLTIMQEDFDEKKLTYVLCEEDIYESLSNIGEIPKKYIYHGHAIDKEKFINSIYKAISFFQTNYEIVIDRILQTNIDKLKTRYPEKFTTEDSIKRVDV